MKKKLFILSLFIYLASCLIIFSQIPAISPPTRLLNEPIDISGDFRDFSNTYYLADSLASFDPLTGSGNLPK